MRTRGTGALGASQGLALLAALTSASAYAVWLDAHQLAAWALALGAGRAAMLLVDGGFKAALVRHPQDLSGGAERRLTRLVGTAAMMLSGLAAVAAAAAVLAGVASPADAGLVGVTVACYLLSHAASLVALARLERAGRFRLVGQAEGAATLLEFALPAALMAAGCVPPEALVIGVLAGRGVRAACLRAGSGAGVPGVADPADNAAEALPWREGLWIQGIAALSMLRDQMHLWLVGPWFGADWSGAYVFGLMACAFASQWLAATVARVAVSALRPLSTVRRAVCAAKAVRRLSVLTLPLLALTLPVLHAADAWLWDGRWQLALSLLPGLLLRVAAALPLAALAPWLLVAVAPRDAAKVHLQWTVAELLLALLALMLFGPAGLAVAMAVGGALGTVWFARALRPHGVALFLRALVRMPAAATRPGRLKHS